MEVSGNATAIARIIEPHVDAVLMVDPATVQVDTDHELSLRVDR